MDRVEPNIPEQMGKMLDSLQQQQDLPFDRGLLLPPLFQIGQSLVLIADEARDPAQFYGLLGQVNRFLTAISIKRVSFEPVYDGRFEPTKVPERLALSRLGPVHQQRVEADLAWLEKLAKDAERSSPAVLLDLLAYENRNEREEAWSEWFDALCERAVDLSPDVLDGLSQGLQDWIETIQDRPFLFLFAKSIGRLIPKLLSSHGAAALDVLLSRLGVAIAERLEMEAGRGEVDPALEELLRVAQNLILRKLSLPNQQAADVVALAMRLRSGPVTGQPLSPEDVLFRLKLIEHLEPFAAEGILLGMVCAFCLEEINFRQGLVASANAREITQQVVDGVAALLGRSDSPSLVRATRMLLRVAPLSPVAMAGEKSQQRLLALSTREGEASYLVDLRRRIIYQPGPENIDDVERVLRYWRSGDIDQLNGLVDIDSLAALAIVQRRDQKIARLINNLADQFCREEQSDVAWLASLPEALVEPDSLIKVAGFEDLDSESVGVLCNVLLVYRALSGKYRSGNVKNRNELNNEALLEEADLQLKLRREQNRLLFSNPTREFAQLVSFEKLKRFGDELDLARDIDVTLEVCSQRCMKSTTKPLQDLATQILVRMVEQAKLSGHMTRLSLDANTPFNKGTLLLLHETLATERTNLIDELRPFVQDSIRRIQNNPLASFSANYRQYAFGEDWKTSADSLVAVLVDDLLATDGGILHLTRFVEQLESDL